MSDYLPPEIIRAILVRLPVKSLLRVRCVSKQWRSLIDSKSFTRHHLDHSNRTLIVTADKIFYLDLDSFERLGVGKTGHQSYYLVRSCNGLLLLVTFWETILLWNPSTRKLNQLGNTPFEEMEAAPGHVLSRFALAYDSKRDDYKIVRVIQRRGGADGLSFTSLANVYSLKSNAWKTIEGFPYMLHPSKTWGVYLNDALHTVARDDYDRVGGLGSEGRIMAFDVVNEVHYEVPKPKVFGFLESVEVMGGLLTAVVSGKENSSEVWVMKEYGVKDSWSKLLCFVPPVSGQRVQICPLAYSKSGDEVLLMCDGTCLNWYNLRTKNVTTACVDGLSATPLYPTFRAEVSVASLVSPHSPAALEAGKQKRIKKKRDDFLSRGFKLVL